MVFASNRGHAGDFPHRLCTYAITVLCYPGQEARFSGKRQNLETAMRAIDGVVVEPGALLPFWRCVGRPTTSAGYAPAAALKRGALTEEVGGSICLISTLLYNVGLLAAMDVAERYCHSVDSYGDARYFELGRDAAVEYAYRDLRLRNALPHPILLRARLDDGTAIAEAWAPCALDLRVSLEVSPPEFLEAPLVRCIDRELAEGCAVDDPGLTGIAVRTRRTVWLDGSRRDEDLGLSVHEPRPRLERHAVAAPLESLY
jgi:vancomycin resistance protein VanW